MKIVLGFGKKRLRKRALATRKRDCLIIMATTKMRAVRLSLNLRKKSNNVKNRSVKNL